MNGHHKLAFWLLGILGTLFTGGTSAWLTSMHTHSRNHGEKIAVLESQLAAQKHQLDRIDQKLDRLLEER
jgi:hypothetical protein